MRCEAAGGVNFPAAPPGDAAKRPLAMSLQLGKTCHRHAGLFFMFKLLYFMSESLPVRLATARYFELYYC